MLGLGEARWLKIIIGGGVMVQRGILEKSFICSCQKTRITIQMIPERVFPVTCRVCERVYEAFGNNGQILVRAWMGTKKPSSYQGLMQPVFN